MQVILAGPPQQTGENAALRLCFYSTYEHCSQPQHNEGTNSPKSVNSHGVHYK